MVKKFTLIITIVILIIIFIALFNILGLENIFKRFMGIEEKKARLYLTDAGTEFTGPYTSQLHGETIYQFKFAIKVQISNVGNAPAEEVRVWAYIYEGEESLPISDKQKDIGAIVPGDKIIVTFLLGTPPRSKYPSFYRVQVHTYSRKNMDVYADWINRYSTL